MKKLAITLLSCLVIFGCDKDEENNEVTLQRVEEALFQSGVQVEYSESFNGTVNNGLNATCAEIYDLDVRGVTRSEIGVDRAIEALQLYRRILLGGKICVTDRSFTDDLIYRAISSLERCRVRWADGLRCNPRF